ncbi:hypothetical protein [Pontibacter sp. H249]|uniref:hypothetical protein n=1 Tax=Pontibacter sp. H249 TaxID=3133420 RepID=UPI0030C4C0A4
MLKFHNYFLPAIAVFMVAAFMHIIRVQHIEINLMLSLMLSLMLTYITGMTAGAIVYTFRNKSFTF